MRRLEFLIKQSRRHTENEQAGVSDGISDMEFAQAMTEAQDKIVTKIHGTNNKLLTKEATIQGVSGQEEYDLPFDIFTFSHVIDFSWTYTGSLIDLFPLEKVSFKERIVDTGDPSRYILRGQKVLINRIPNAAAQHGLMQYNPRLPRLDIRRGKVSAVALDNVTKKITSLTLDAAFVPLISNAYFDEADFITVVTKRGEIQMKAIGFSAIDSGTGVVTVDSDFVFEDGETITTDDFVCLGRYSTTHSELPEIAEKYLITYCNKRILFRDCSDQVMEQDRELKEMQDDIIDLLAQVTSDVTYIPMINGDLF